VQGAGFTVSRFSLYFRSQVSLCCSSSAGEGAGCQWCRLWGIRFGVWCLELSIWDLKFSNRDSGFGVWGLEFGVWDLGRHRV
jgi:hypothetical protein